MELTKEQVQYIDHRLENDGIKFWDIRIEMLDHVVLDVEKNLKPENSEYEFKEIVQNSFESLGWKENFNGGGFEYIFKQRLKSYNKNQNKNFIEYMKDTFLSGNFILGILSLVFTVFYFQENKLALKSLFFIMIGFYIVFMLKFAIKHKVMKSARLSSAILFASFPITIFNIVFYMPKFFFDYEIGIFALSWIMIVITAFSAIGVSYLNKELEKAQSIYNQLIS